jgi:DNA-binding transcriptional ArsR family regulator
MPRAATNSDAFNAIAEPRRRRILSMLRSGDQPVTDLAAGLDLKLPATSKHLRVLREVGLVDVRKIGKQRVYRLDARGIQPVHEWTGGFVEFWAASFDRLDDYVQELQKEEDRETG